MLLNFHHTCYVVNVSTAYTSLEQFGGFSNLYPCLSDCMSTLLDSEWYGKPPEKFGMEIANKYVMNILTGHGISQLRSRPT